jgi:hypothetical protein
VEEVVVDILLDHKLLVVEHSCHFAARLAGGETMRCRRTTCLFGAEKKNTRQTTLLQNCVPNNEI